MNINFVKYFFTTSVMILFLASCASKPQQEKLTKLGVDESEMTTDKRANKEAARIQSCKGELDALKSLNPKQNLQLQSKFSQLMKKAAQYSNIRNQVSENTRETIDALYRYKVNLLCANIVQAALTNLTDLEEKNK